MSLNWRDWKMSLFEWNLRKLSIRDLLEDSLVIWDGENHEIEVLSWGVNMRVHDLVVLPYYIDHFCQNRQNWRFWDFRQFWAKLCILSKILKFGELGMVANSTELSTKVDRLWRFWDFRQNHEILLILTCLAGLDIEGVMVTPRS